MRWWLRDHCLFHYPKGKGGGYSGLFSALLEEQCLNSDFIDKYLRRALLGIAGNYDEVMRWMKDNRPESDKWKAPRTIWEKFDAYQKEIKRDAYGEDDPEADRKAKERTRDLVVKNI
jgi:hypothetical protein